jgi:excisionase family DNA binding protein
MSAKSALDVKPLDEVAALTGVPRRTLQDWLHYGDLTAYRIKGDRKRYLDINEVNRLRTPIPERKTHKRREA